MFMTLKNETVNILLILSIFFYGLDSYSVFDVPFSWIGLALILAIAVVKDLRILFIKVFGTLLSITNKHLVNFIELLFSNFDNLVTSPDPIKIGYL